jgi:carbohydrate kinase (thermoresistant glucokinase family)
MGVSGSGKSTVGKALAVQLGFEFIEGDLLHSVKSIAQMASGHALSDAERMPWLNRVGVAMATGLDGHPGVVAACSALRRSYRDTLRAHVPDAFFVTLEASFEVISARMLARPHSFMPPSLLPSQFDTLEPLGADERGIRVDATQGTDVMVATVERALRLSP